MKQIIITLEVENDVESVINQLENLLDESDIECIYKLEAE